MGDSIQITLADEIEDCEAFGPCVMVREHWSEDEGSDEDLLSPLVCVSNNGARDLGIDPEELAREIREMVRKRLEAGRV